MKVPVLFFAMLLTASTCLAQDYWQRPYATPDSIARTVKKTRDLQSLANQLTQSFHEPADKYRALYTWVALNIKYDCEALLQPAKRKTEPQDVVSKGKSVCQGYANLFQALCTLSGLECQVIIGWSKTKPADIAKKLSPETNHAWNAIQLDSSWYLCDVTWGAGHVTGNCDKFTQDFRGYYFCTPPDLFAYKHFPQAARWLLGSRISQKEFEDSPLYFSEAIGIAYKPVPAMMGILPYKRKETIHFQFTTHTTIQSVIASIPGQKYGQPIAFRQDGQQVSLQYEFEKYVPGITFFIDNKPVVEFSISR